MVTRGLLLVLYATLFMTFVFPLSSVFGVYLPFVSVWGVFGVTRADCRMFPLISDEGVWIFLATKGPTPVTTGTAFMSYMIF